MGVVWVGVDGVWWAVTWRFLECGWCGLLMCLC